MSHKCPANKIDRLADSLCHYVTTRLPIWQKEFPAKRPLCNFVGMAAYNPNKEFARLMFVHDRLTQKEVAERVGVTEKTMSKWVNDEGWEDLRNSLFLSRTEEIRRIQGQLKELNDDIMTREAGKRYPSSGEADILSKLTAALKNLERDVQIHEVVEVMTSFNQFVRDVDLGAAQALAEWQDKFVKSLIK